MARTVREIPPPLELACLSALWSLQEANVRSVQEIVAQSRPLAYTTIMTVLDRLVRKGRLTRRKVGRAFVYTPQGTRDALRRTALRELVDVFFDGSQEALLAFLHDQNAPVPLRDQNAPAPRHAPASLSERGIDTVLL